MPTALPGEFLVGAGPCRAGVGGGDGDARLGTPVLVWQN